MLANQRIMKAAITLLAGMLLASCSQKSETTGGTVYSGTTSLNKRFHQFVASSAATRKDVILTMTGRRELTFSFNDKISHLDYEEEVIIISSETDSLEWSAKKVKDGFELADGTVLEYNRCRGWAICLQAKDTREHILKGKYSLRGNGVEITLWISDSESHAELLGIMANALFNRSRNEKLSIDVALETLSSQVWTY